MTEISPIAVAIGDPNGIGPEIAVKAAISQLDSGHPPVLVGDTYVIEHYLRLCSSGLKLREWGEVLQGDAIYHVPVAAMPTHRFAPGQISPEAGAATVAYVTKAVALAQEKLVTGVIGCPHTETAVNQAGIDFSGYPGLIAKLTGTPEDEVFLMLVTEGLRVAHVTLHESVQSALNRLSTDRVIKASLATLNAMGQLGFSDASLGVFGVNPHAGEGGLFGDDDARVTEPAVRELKARGYNVEGPVGADVLLGQRKHDVYLAMFHDQGHIPVKLLSPLCASALSIGTNVLFSSVGHGSALDIAGKGIASPVSVATTLSVLQKSIKS